jgi:AraC-like DNA-binding protein
MATEHLTAARVRSVGAPGAFQWPAALIFWGLGFGSAGPRHSHNSVVAMALKSRFRIRGGPSRPWIVCEAALVKANARLQVDASTTPMLFALVDPESELGGGLFEGVTQDITPVQDATVALWRGQLGDPVSLDAARVESWFRELMSHRQPPRLHPGVRKVLPVIREELDGDRRVALKRLAAIAGLSDSRFIHVFTTSVGLPLRRYILWLRLQRAYGEMMMMGATLTEAAHRAGFADAAHLSRTTKRTCGATTKAALKTFRQVSQVWFASDLSIIPAPVGLSSTKPAVAAG